MRLLNIIVDIPTQSLRRKERESEQAMERLAGEKIAYQQHVSTLKKELTASWDHIDVNAILPDSAAGGRGRDQETNSTTTASEQPDLEDDLPGLLRGGAGVMRGSRDTTTKLVTNRNLTTAPTNCINGGGQITNRHSVMALPSSHHSHNNHIGGGVATAIIASSTVLQQTTTRTRNLVGGSGIEPGSASSLTSASSVPFKHSTNLRPSPLSVHNPTSVVTYTPQASPQPHQQGLANNTCTYHITPQTNPLITYTPQPSPQSPTNSINTPRNNASLSPTHSPLNSHAALTDKRTIQETLCDPNQPLNLSTNATMLSSSNDKIQDSLSPSASKVLLPHSSSNKTGFHCPKVQVQTTSPNWVLQQTDSSFFQETQKVEFKIVGGVNNAQIIRPINNLGHLPDSATSVAEGANSVIIRQSCVTTSGIPESFPSATQTTKFPNHSSTNSITTNTATNTSGTMPHFITSKTQLTSPSSIHPALPVQLSVPGTVNNKGNDGGYTTVRLSSCDSTVLETSNGAAATLMPLVQNNSNNNENVHHIPLRIAATATNVLNIITPDVGYKLLPDTAAFNSSNALAIALPADGEWSFFFNPSRWIIIHSRKKILALTITCPQ